MEIRIAYKHLELTPAIEEQIRHKASKLKKYFQGKMHVEWTCSCDKEFHSSDVKVTGAHFSCHASAQAENLYKTFDDVLHKLEKQLSKRKEKVMSHKKSEPAFADEHVHDEEEEY